MITFSDFQTPKPDTITFTVSNTNSSFVNALRRTIITDVQTVSFNVDDYTNSDLTVIKNTSSVGWVTCQYLSEEFASMSDDINEVSSP